MPEIICSDVGLNELRACDTRQRNTCCSLQTWRSPSWSWLLGARSGLHFPANTPSADPSPSVLLVACGCGSSCSTPARGGGLPSFHWLKPQPPSSFTPPVIQRQKENDELLFPQKWIDHVSAEIIGAQPQVRALRSRSSPEPPSPSSHRSWRQRGCRLDGGLRNQCAETSVPAETCQLSNRGWTPCTEEPPAGESPGGSSGRREAQSAPERAQQVLQVQTLSSSPRFIRRGAASGAAPGRIPTGQEDLDNFSKTHRRCGFFLRVEGENHHRVVLESQLGLTCSQRTCPTRIQPHVQEAEHRVRLQSSPDSQVSVWAGKRPWRGHSTLKVDFRCRPTACWEVQSRTKLIAKKRTGFLQAHLCMDECVAALWNTIQSNTSSFNQNQSVG